jgi:hypothetical protein
VNRIARAAVRVFFAGISVSNILIYSIVVVGQERTALEHPK